MAPLHERPVEEQRDYVRWAVKMYPCVTALDEEQLEAAIDRILEQSHPDNLGRGVGRKPRHELPTTIIIASESWTKEELDVRLERAMDQADLLTKGYLEVADDYWANLANSAALGHEEWKNVRIPAGVVGMEYSDQEYEEEDGGEEPGEAIQGGAEEGGGEEDLPYNYNANMADIAEEPKNMGFREADFGMDDSDHNEKVYKSYAGEGEVEKDEQEKEEDAEEEKVQRRMWWKVKLSTFPEAAGLEPHELEAAIDRILDPAPPAEDGSTRMTYAEINLVLAYKRKELDDDNMHPEELQAKVRSDLITYGYVEVDQEYWAKIEPCFATSDLGIYNSDDPQVEEEPLDLEKHEDDN